MMSFSRKLVGFSVVLAFAVGPATASELGKAVIERLGRVEPTPVPSPVPEEKIRLIASFTMQNKPNGDSVITFEAADFGEKKNGQYRVIAIEQYALIEPKTEALELRDRIVEKIRALEQDLLDYVEIVGPPRPPQRIHEMGGAGSAGAYR